MKNLSTTLSKGLAEDYAEVNVHVVDYPNLTLPPFSFAAKGFGGNPTVVQVGDPAYCIPDTLKDKLYDFKDIPKVLGLKSAFICVAG